MLTELNMLNVNNRVRYNVLSFQKQLCHCTDYVLSVLIMTNAKIIIVNRVLFKHDD